MADTEKNLEDVEAKLDHMLEQIRQIKVLLGIIDDESDHPALPGPYSDMSGR